MVLIIITATITALTVCRPGSIMQITHRLIAADKAESDVIVVSVPVAAQDKVSDTISRAKRTHDPDAFAVTVLRRGNSDNSMIIQYRETGLAGMEVKLYTYDELNYQMFSSQIANSDNVTFTIANLNISGNEASSFYITLTENGLDESNKVLVPYEAIEGPGMVSPERETRARLTSAIDSSLFDAVYDPETGRVSMVDLSGAEIGFRIVENKFLVEYDTNGNMMETPLDSSHWEQYGNSRAFAKEFETFFDNTRSIIENPELYSGQIENNFEQYVKKSEQLEANTGLHPDQYEEPLYHPILDELELSYEGRNQYLQELEEWQSEHRVQLSDAPISTLSFDTGTVWHTVSYTGSPQNGAFVGGGHYHTSSTTDRVELHTYSYPLGLNSINVYFTNLIGDNY